MQYKTMSDEQIDSLQSTAFMWGYITGGGVISAVFLALKHWGIL